MTVKIRKTCRLCGALSLTPVLNIGDQMLASAFASKENQEWLPTRKVPLDLVRCDPNLAEDACGLVQLRHSFPPDIMYTDYWYASGINQTMRDALADITQKACSFANLNKGDSVVDIGCNDGTLLKSYKVEGLDKIGFDPAQNFLDQKDEGFERITTYFNRQSFTAVRGLKKAKVVTSIAMFYDLEDPSTFTREVADILADDGVWILQMADLANMLKNNMFDNICHEHLTYFHLAPMEYLLKKNSLKLVDIEKNNVNGSSYRFYIRKMTGVGPTASATQRISKIRFEEFNMALDTDVPYREFAENVQRNRHDLLFFIKREQEKGKKTFVYGASTKGNVLLQYCGIDETLVPYAAERNPKKWGTKTLGSNIPIISEEEARKLKPDYFLVLPYHFLEEMQSREKEFTDRGGKFIVPVPSVKIIPST